MLQPAPPRRARRACDPRLGWGFRRTEPDWWPLPAMEEVEARLHSRPGFIASLTPEQIEAIMAYDGPEVLGPADGPRRTF
jgi:hypothetical protein